MNLLSERLKQGAIARLEMINLSSSPESAAEHDIKSVPFLLLNDFQFEGGMSADELDYWIDQSHSEQGMSAYFAHLIGKGRRMDVEARLRSDPAHFKTLAELLAAPDSGMDLRLGVAATFEELSSEPYVEQAITALGPLSESTDARLRADVCHLLSLMDHADAHRWLNARLDDEDAEVREIVREAMEDRAR